MGTHGIIRNPTVFLHKFQIRFAGFEKDLDVPSLSINTDDLFLRNGDVRTHQYQPVLPFALIADEYQLCRDAFPILFDLHKYGQKIAGTSPPLLVAAVDLFDIEPFTLVSVFCLAFFHHGYGVKMLLLFQFQYGFGRWKPTIEQDKFCRDARTLCGMDQLHHDIGGFAPWLEASSSRKGAAVMRLTPAKQVFVLRRWKQAVADWDKGVPVRPSQSEHPESGSVFHGTVVENPGKHLCLFGPGAVKQTVINDKHIFPFFISQWLHETADDFSGKQHREALPVDPCIVQKTVDGIFWECPFKCAGLHLHIDAPVGKHHAEKIPEDIYDRDAFFFPGITFEKKAADVESFHKFCGKIRNVVSVICNLWYTWHGINLLAV